MSGLRAAVIGAGRIGRHHAKWYARAGCEVAGFVTSSAESVSRRAAELAEECGVVGPGFASVEEMLEEVQPDLVSVCTPAEWHHAPARAALERGIPTLCEKPLTWHATPSVALAQAAELCDLADRAGVPLAVNLQYTACAAMYTELVGPIGRPKRCQVTLESRGRGAERTPSEVWMELGPHALSLAFALLPGARFDPDDVVVDLAPRSATACLGLRTATGRVETIVTVAQRLEGDLVRRFGVDERLVGYSGRNNDAGVYCTYLATGDVAREFPDLMQVSIERFVAAVRGQGDVLVGGRAGLENLVAQVSVAGALSTDREM